MELTPRERVRATLNHQEPDRVPISLGGSANHLTEERFLLLRDHFGFQEISRRTLVGFYTTPDYNPLLDCLGTDMRFIHIRPPHNYIANNLRGEFRPFVDEWGLTHELVSGYYNLSGSPLAEDLTIEKIEKTFTDIRESHIRSMVLNPRTGEVFEANEQESLKNGKKLQTCKGSLFDKARGISTCAYVTKTRIDQARQIIGRVYENRLPLRVSGGSALDLCFVAEGRHIAHVSLGAHTWDVEAGIHMVRKAKGVVITFNHNSRTSSMGLMAAASEAVMDELRSLLGDIIT